MFVRVLVLVLVCDFEEKHECWFHCADRERSMISYYTSYHRNQHQCKMNWMKKQKKATNKRVRLSRKKENLHVLRFLFPPETSDVTAQHSLIQRRNSFSPSFDFSIRSYYICVFFSLLSLYFGAQSKSLFILLFANRHTIIERLPSTWIHWFKSHFAIKTIHIFWWCAKISTFAITWITNQIWFPQFVLKIFRLFSSLLCLCERVCIQLINIFLSAISSLGKISQDR